MNIIDMLISTISTSQGARTEREASSSPKLKETRQKLPSNTARIRFHAITSGKGQALSLECHCPNNLVQP